MRKLQTVQINPADAYEVDQVLGPCPLDGRHSALFRAASQLHYLEYEPEEATVFLRSWLSRAPRTNEIEDAVRNA
jgi:hypothetical protein